MATKKRRARTKSPKINWGIVGFIAVVVLAICAWQISVKPQSEAAENYRWAKMVGGMSATINKLNSEVSVSWTEMGPGAPFRIDGYRILVAPRGGVTETYDLNINQTNSDLRPGETYLTRYATVKSAGAMKAASAVVSVYPMIYHQTLSPYSAAIEAAGSSVGAILNL